MSTYHEAFAEMHPRCKTCKAFLPDLEGNWGVCGNDNDRPVERSHYCGYHSTLNKRGANVNSRVNPQEHINNLARLAIDNPEQMHDIMRQIKELTE